MPYLCNLLVQLQGTYEVDTPDGVEIINVVLVEVPIGEHQYATVQWIHGSRERFPDRYIFEDLTQFNLCSIDGAIEAVMVKGVSIMFSVEWILIDGSKWTWRRASDVVFDMVSINSLADPNSRRGSISSVASSLDRSVIGWNNEPAIGYNGVFGLHHTFPDLPAENYAPTCTVSLNDIKKDFSNGHFDSSFKSVDCDAKTAELSFSDPIATTVPSESRSNFQCASCNVSKNEKDYLEDLKKLCSENPSVMNWIMKWKDEEMRMKLTNEEYQKLTHGRVWVTARLGPKTKDVAWEVAAKELKGAYQETENESEIYVQVAPLQGNLKRYRLRKNSVNLWVFELQNGERDHNWSICAEQLEGEHWVDHRYHRKPIVVKVVPLSKILKRLEGQQVPEIQSLEKSLQFVFSTCNQRKLSSQLKMRNIKHNIANLTTKLNRQYSLQFARQISDIAEKISAEL